MDERETNDDEDVSRNQSGLNYYLKQKWKLCVTLFCLFSLITMVRFYSKNKKMKYNFNKKGNSS